MQNNTINYYEECANSLSTRYESADVSEVQELLLQTFAQNSHILEIGCGSGRDASFMVKNSYDVTAVDGSKNMIEEARKIHSELTDKLLCRTLPDDLEFNIKFDGIYSIATLMHLPKEHLKRAISNIYNLLNQNGKFFMSVSLFRDDIEDNGFDKKGRFFLVLSLEEWINICKKVGFKVLKSKINKDGLNRSGIEWLTLVANK